MSVRDFEAMFTNLNIEFVDLKSKIDVLINKYAEIEKQLEKQKKFRFKCRKCNKKYENLAEYQKHKNDEGSCQANFKCDECDKTFRSENQLTIHQKKHETFECEECGNDYNFEGLLEKHNEAVHGSMKIFCHYYNNEKECPFDDQCIFAHEDSPECKFAKGCERLLCMFQHEEKDEPDEEDDESDDESDDEKDVDKNEENIITINDIEPSLKKVEEAMDKVNILLQKQTFALKCDTCDFEARNVNGLTMHKKAKHTDNSK